MQHRFASTRHGRRHYLTAGDSGPPLILMHTNGQSAHEYRFCLGKLAQRHRVIAWDMGPGFKRGTPRK